MEAVATTLEGLTAADEATRSFLASYTTYLRTHARSAADALTRRREASAQRQAELGADITALASAESGQAQARARCEEAENALAGLRARHDQLKSSRAYQAVEQLADLERLVRTNEQTAAEAAAELSRRSTATARARADAEQAAGMLADRQAEVSRTAAELADHAAAAGIGWQAADGRAGRVHRTRRRPRHRPAGSRPRDPGRPGVAPPGRARPRSGPARTRPGAGGGDRGRASRAGRRRRGGRGPYGRAGHPGAVGGRPRRRAGRGGHAGADGEPERGHRGVRRPGGRHPRVGVHRRDRRRRAGRP